MKKYFFYISLLIIVHTAAYSQDLEVHEWGTFTVVQNDKGETLIGVNTDDEPLPHFVYKRLASTNQIDTKIIQGFSKGLPRSFSRNMKLRLETPVVYFYQKSKGEFPPFTFKAEFKNGIISEVFPKTNDFNQVSSPSDSVATWQGIHFSENENFKNTNNAVWLEPRKVQAKAITVNGETEKYLFYRGMGAMDIPLHVKSNRNTNEISILGDITSDFPKNLELKIPELWFVNVDEDQNLSFEKLKGINFKNADLVTGVAFTPKPASQSNQIEPLFTSMRQALLEEGLFEDEANAMLNTWKQSYFKQPGSRIFFMVPRKWVDTHLPISLSVDAKINRAMIGRIEIMSEFQYNNLKSLREANLKKEDFENLMVGGLKKNPTMVCNDEATKSNPIFYQNYLKLGRFRDAFIFESNKNKPNENLKFFLDQLQYY